MNNVLKNVIENIQKVIIGKEEVIERMLISLISGGHVLIEDVPGVGKTQLAAALSRSVNGKFNRIQFTPDVLPSDITGFSMFNPSTREFEYKQGAAMCNFLLADEINRTSTKTQSSLLEIMEEGQVTIDGKTHELPKLFMVLATQNSIEHVGTYELPEAQLDRFLMKLALGYPTKNEEEAILNRFGENNPLETLTAVADIETIIKIQEAVKQVMVHDSLKTYIVDIADKTRTHKDIVLGVSPRGSLALLKSAKALAFLRGREYVLPDDIQELACPVLSHRIMMNYNSGTNKNDGDYIIKEVIESVKCPSFKRF